MIIRSPYNTPYSIYLRGTISSNQGLGFIRFGRWGWRLRLLGLLGLALQVQGFGARVEGGRI